MDHIPADDEQTLPKGQRPETIELARLNPYIGEAPRDAATTAAQAPADPAIIRNILTNRSGTEPLARKDFFSDSIDRWLFLLFVGAGVAVVATLKLGLSVYGIWTAVPPVVILIGYAVVVQGQPYFRLHPDRLGDNCYYMGFIFTLASLSFALMQLESMVGSARVSFLDSLIGNFGIALFSTIVGITLRVSLIQFRREVEDEEEQIRQDLGVVATRLRDQLSLAVLDLEGFRVRTNQVLEEHLIKSTQEFGRVQQGMVQTAAALAEKFAAIQTNLAQRTEAVVATMISKGTEEFARVQQGMVEVAASAAQRFAALQAELAEGTGVIIGTMITSAKSMTGSADKIAKEMRQLTSRVERIETPPDLLVRHLQQAEMRISELATALQRVTDSDTKRSEAFERATNELLKHLAVLTETSKFSKLELAAGQLQQQLKALTTGMATYQQTVDGLVVGAQQERAALATIREALQQDAHDSAEALRCLEATLADIARGIASRLGG